MERIQRTISEFLGERSWPELPATATVAEALAAMNDSGLDCVLVVEDGRLVGIFTGRDFLHRVAAPQRAPADTPLSAVMTAQPEAVKRHHDVAYAINRMAVRNMRRLPVVDEGRPVGLLTVWVVIAHLDDVFEDLLGRLPDPPTDELWLDLGGG
jgi:signal-transduction protein with cAMP-binding, CBS, and nucleotidyltransferase domain